jgi:hypothetical protein
MVVAAALVSLTVLATAPDAQQASADQAPPFTLSGVRHATAAVEPPIVQGEAVPPVPLPSRPLARSAQQQLNVETLSPPRPVTLPPGDRFVTPSLAPAGPAWHQEFRAMTVPAYAASEFELMGNSERAVAAASSVVFGLAVDGVSRLVQQWRSNHQHRKVEKLRRQIDDETAAVERLHGASQATREAGSNGSGDKKPTK